MALDMNKLKGDGDVLAMNPLGASAAQAQNHFTTIGASAANEASVTNGAFWAFTTNRHDYYVWYNITGTNLSVSDPVIADRVGIPVSMTVAEVAFKSNVTAATVAQLSKLSEITVTSSALGFRILNNEYGPVSAATVGTDVDSASIIMVVEASVIVGVDRPVISAKFVIHTSAGLVEAVIGEDGAVFDVAGSAHRIEDYNKGLGGSRLGVQVGIVGDSADDPVKADNLIMSIGGSGAVPAFAEGSTISGVV